MRPKILGMATGPTLALNQPQMTFFLTISRLNECFLLINRLNFHLKHTDMMVLFQLFSLLAMCSRLSIHYTLSDLI